MRLALLLLASLFRAALSDKDDSYYIAGTGNPNVNSKMYWKDSNNVLQDLSQFSALYVRYHSCAWTLMQTEDDGNDVDENDYWYMGKIPPFGANVAFSLYGVLKGSSAGGSCSKTNFINSFHTNTGVTDFTDAMYAAGKTGFYTYTSSGSSGLTSECSGSGYGLGCSSNGFGIHKYSSSTCNPANYNGVKDSLSSLNSLMQATDCVKIYSAGSSSYSSSSYSSSSSSSSSALNLLSNSHSCFYQDYFAPDGDCPDPYNVLSGYQTRFHQGITESRQRNPYQLYRERAKYNDQIQKGKTMSAIAVPLFILACLIFTWDVTRHGFRSKRRGKRLDIEQGGDYVEGPAGYHTCGHFDVNVKPMLGAAVNTRVNDFVNETTRVLVGDSERPAELPPSSASVANATVASTVYYPPNCVMGVDADCVAPGDNDDGILDTPNYVSTSAASGRAPLSPSYAQQPLPKYCPPPREDLDIDAISLGATTIDTRDAMSIGAATGGTTEPDTISIRLQHSMDPSLAVSPEPIKEEDEDDKESSVTSSHPKIDEISVPSTASESKSHSNKAAADELEQARLTPTRSLSQTNEQAPDQSQKTVEEAPASSNEQDLDAADTATESAAPEEQDDHSGETTEDENKDAILPEDQEPEMAVTTEEAAAPEESAPEVATATTEQTAEEIVTPEESAPEVATATTEQTAEEIVTPEVAAPEVATATTEQTAEEIVAPEVAAPEVATATTEQTAEEIVAPEVAAPEVATATTADSALESAASKEQASGAVLKEEEQATEVEEELTGAPSLTEDASKDLSAPGEPGPEIVTTATEDANEEVGAYEEQEPREAGIPTTDSEAKESVKEVPQVETPESSLDIVDDFKETSEELAEDQAMPEEVEGVFEEDAVLIPSGSVESEEVVSSDAPSPFDPESAILLSRSYSPAAALAQAAQSRGTTPAGEEVISDTPEEHGDEAQS